MARRRHLWPSLVAALLLPYISNSLVIPQNEVTLPERATPGWVNEIVDNFQSKDEYLTFAYPFRRADNGLQVADLIFTFEVPIDELNRDPICFPKNEPPIVLNGQKFLRYTATAPLSDPVPANRTEGTRAIEIIDAQTAQNSLVPTYFADDCVCLDIVNEDGSCALYGHYLSVVFPSYGRDARIGLTLVYSRGQYPKIHRVIESPYRIPNRTIWPPSESVEITTARVSIPIISTAPTTFRKVYSSTSFAAFPPTSTLDLIEGLQTARPTLELGSKPEDDDFEVVDLTAILEQEQKETLHASEELLLKQLEVVTEEQEQEPPCPIKTVKKALSALAFHASNVAQAIIGSVTSPQYHKLEHVHTEPGEGMESDVIVSHDELGSPPSPLTEANLADHDQSILSPADPSQPSTPTALQPVQRNDQFFRAFKITSILIIIVLIVSCVFHLLMRDPRRRADCAARCEERRNKRLFRQAVWRQRRQRWMQSFRTTFLLAKVNEETEKFATRSDIDERTRRQWLESREKLRKEDLNGHTVAEEICALRKAHGWVDEMIKHEKPGGDEKMSYAYSSRDAIRIARQERRARRLRRYSDVASEKSMSSAPPPYCDVQSVDGGVVSDAESSPHSSVIDTSPRTSVYMGGSDSEKD